MKRKIINEVIGRVLLKVVSATTSFSVILTKEQKINCLYFLLVFNLIVCFS